VEAFWMPHKLQSRIIIEEEEEESYRTILYISLFFWLA